MKSRKRKLNQKLISNIYSNLKNDDTEDLLRRWINKSSTEEGLEAIKIILLGRGVKLPEQIVEPEELVFRIKDFSFNEEWSKRFIFSILTIPIALIILSLILKWHIIDTINLISFLFIYIVGYLTVRTKTVITYHCSECGTEIQRDERYCKICKIQLADDDLVEEEQPDEFYDKETLALIKFIVIPFIVLSISSFIFFPSLILNSGIYKYMLDQNALWVAYIISGLGMGITFFGNLLYVYRGL